VVSPWFGSTAAVAAVAAAAAEAAAIAVGIHCCIAAVVKPPRPAGSNPRLTEAVVAVAVACTATEAVATVGAEAVVAPA